MNFNSAAQPDNYWETPEGRQAQEWYSANPGQGAAEYQAQNYRGEDAGPSYGMLSTTPGAGGGTGDPTNGMFPGGWEYPVNNPGAAVRNYLASQGRSGNFFNEAWQGAIDDFSSGLLPQFFSQMIESGANDQTMQSRFGDFIGGRATGSIAAPTMAQSGQHLGNINALLQQVNAIMQGPLAKVNAERMARGLPAYNMSVPADRQAFMAEVGGMGGMGIDPMRASIAGMMPTSQDQAAMYLSAYLPSLGPALSSGLGRIVQGQQRNFGDSLGRLLGSQNKSFMDYLTGSLGLGR